ncbi:MAG: DUF1311 domain-containing protein [Granulosicoccus sp.]|nr:DUF1311 domain-containing protein [Granulosicoccus sp.]
MSIRRGKLVVLFFVLGLVLRAEAQEQDVLTQCSSKSTNLDEVHNCLDDYLDVMDGNIQAISNFLTESLSGKALAGLNSSQAAFAEYRRQNCLWYLDFSSPRSEAEQIAKNCLATMSQQRLRELQNLVTADDSSDVALRGYYVYGAERNSFQPCGSSDRYWLEGDSVAVVQAQQSYLTVATSELQLLHAVFVGKINDELEAPAAHSGVFELTNLIELRVPTDSDCPLPGSRSDDDDPSSVLAVSNEDLSREVADDEEEEEQEEPEQQLTAYFGAWLVDCIEISGRKSCELEAALSDGVNKAADLSDEDDGSPRVIINRSPENSTFVELFFPDREIDSPARIHWQIDAKTFGDIVDSDIRVDESGTRQIVKEGQFLTADLLPMLIEGTKIQVDVLDSVDDSSGEKFSGTLRGLTKALVFADDFVQETS